MYLGAEGVSPETDVRDEARLLVSEEKRTRRLGDEDVEVAVARRLGDKILAEEVVVAVARPASLSATDSA